jgi:hypothetical protein
MLGSASRRLGFGNRPRPLVPGLPPGLDRRLLQEACPVLRGESIDQLSHVHLSPFKGHGGAYRIYVNTASGMQWTVCFKDCRYGPTEAPALDQYPVAVGRSEYAIYARATARLQAFLPEVYHSEEVQPDQQ